MMKGKSPAHTGLNTPITTPAHVSTSSTSRQPPQAAPPERDRKVSFAQPTTDAGSSTNTAANRTTASSTPVNKRPSPPAPAPAQVSAPLPENQNKEGDADESYHFYSDDDAFLALVDLGEGDLGQPVLEEADLGRPIDGEDEENDSRTPIYLDGSGGEESSGDADSGAGAGAGKRHDVPEQGTLGGPSRLEILSRVLPPNQSVPNIAPHNNQPPRNNPQHRQQQHRQPNNNPPQNENRLPAPGPPSAKRLITPAMGGFHFPPTMVSSSSSSTMSQSLAMLLLPQGAKSTAATTAAAGD